MLETFLVGFSDYSSSFRAMVFPRPAAPIFCSVSRVSEATLDTFLVGFSDKFVLQGHGVSPSGSADFLFCF